MDGLLTLLSEQALRAGIPTASLLRQHVLDGLLRRVASSSQAGALLLRGGLLSRAWLGAARRSTEDADFLGLFPRDLDSAIGRLHEVLGTVLAEDDGVRFHRATLVARVIWEETPFPGVRFGVEVGVEGVPGEQVVQIDVGFGDPVVPDPVWLDYPALLPGCPARVLTCRPETLVGWKLHGLFEHGAKRWRAKDLADLWLLLRLVKVQFPDLTEAVRVAFASRDCPLEVIPPVVYNPDWWTSSRARERWEKYRATTAGVPADLAEVAREVACALRPALGPLLALPPDR